MVSTAVNMDTPAAAPPCPAKSPSLRRTVSLTATAFMAINTLSITLQSQKLKIALSWNSVLNLLRLTTHGLVSMLQGLITATAGFLFVVLEEE